MIGSPVPKEATPTESVGPLDGHGSQVQSMFSRIAHGYDRANRWMSLGIDGRWRRRAVRDLVPVGSPPRARILDLCAGTLDSSLEIHRAFPQADIVAGDFSAGMLARGRSKLHGEAVHRIHPRPMDAHSLPAVDGEYDAIFCAFGVRNLSDLRRATAEQSRCLRPGGQLVVLEFFVPERITATVLHALYNRLVLPFIGWAATGDLPAYRYLPRSIGRFVTTEQYVALLTEHGFAQANVEHLTFGMASVVRAIRTGH